MFKELTDEEKMLYQEWARNNYIPGGKISGVWHPVVQQECVEMNKEQLSFTERDLLLLLDYLLWGRRDDEKTGGPEGRCEDGPPEGRCEDEKIAPADETRARSAGGET